MLTGVRCAPRFPTALRKLFSALRIDLGGGRKRLPPIKRPQGRNLAPSAAGPLFWGDAVLAAFAEDRNGSGGGNVQQQVNPGDVDTRERLDEGAADLWSRRD
jgi:hypothetical protein